MTAIEAYIQQLVSNIKEDSFFGTTRFLKEYTEKKIESPLVDFLVVTALKSKREKRSFLGGNLQQNARIAFSIYAPPEKGGRGLLEMSLRLKKAIRKADTERLVTSTEISPTEFNQNIKAITRKVYADLLYCDEGE